MFDAANDPQVETATPRTGNDSLEFWYVAQARDLARRADDIDTMDALDGVLTGKDTLLSAAALVGEEHLDADEWLSHVQPWFPVRHSLFGTTLVGLPGPGPAPGLWGKYETVKDYWRRLCPRTKCGAGGIFQKTFKGQCSATFAGKLNKTKQKVKKPLGLNSTEQAAVRWAKNIFRSLIQQANAQCPRYCSCVSVHDTHFILRASNSSKGTCTVKVKLALVGFCE